jgi:hypothetical protein
MHTSAVLEPRLGSVKEEFADAFVRTAAAKRAVDPTATLTSIEREAAAYVEQWLSELRGFLQFGTFGRSRNRFPIDRPRHASSRKRRVADTTSAMRLVAKLREQTISSPEAACLIDLLTKLDVKGHAGDRYEEIAGLDRALGF